MPKSASDIVDDWFNQEFSQGPIARHTEARNQLFEALPALKQQLEDAGKSGDEPETPPASQE